MPGPDLLLAFAMATLTIGLLPGPAILYTAAQTLARGRRGGLMAALGLHLGGYVHVLAAAFGLSVLFAHVPTLYLVLKLVGAAYLVWLGVGLLRTRFAASELPAVRTRSAHRAFIESVSVEVLNPKTAIFYVAFLPQFVDSHAAFPVAVQFLIFGILTNLTFSAADLVTVCFTRALLARLERSARAQKISRIAGGSLLIGLGARLALDRA
jgi:threonine/homoserine/homoserine lactone efflux protein